MLGLCRLGRSPSHIVLRGAALLPRARTATQPPSKVLGKASRSLVPPPLAPRAHGRGGADFLTCSHDAQCFPVLFPALSTMHFPFIRCTELNTVYLSLTSTWT